MGRRQDVARRPDAAGRHGARGHARAPPAHPPGAARVPGAVERDTADRVPQPAQFPTLASIEAYGRPVYEAGRGAIASADAPSLAAPLRVPHSAHFAPPGAEVTHASKSETVLQVWSHTTHHRGQIRGAAPAAGRRAAADRLRGLDLAGSPGPGVGVTVGTPPPIYGRIPPAPWPGPGRAKRRAAGPSRPPGDPMKKLLALAAVAVLTVACKPSEPAKAAASPDVAAWQQRAQSVTITRDDWGIAAHPRQDRRRRRLRDDLRAGRGRLQPRRDQLHQRAWAGSPKPRARRRSISDLRMKLFIDPEDAEGAVRSRARTGCKELMDAWADGLNFYLATHPEVKPRVITRSSRGWR